MTRRPDSVVEAEFRELERMVRQRDCRHEETVEIREIGGRTRTLCVNCTRANVEYLAAGDWGPRS